MIEMSLSSIIGLVNNAALLLALGLIYDMLWIRLRGGKPTVQKFITGVFLGAIGIAIMLNPWEFRPGVVFDTRSVLLSTSGLFFGTVPALLTMLMTGAFRLHMGGTGVWTGVAVIVTSGGIGLAWRHLRRNREEDLSILELYLFGIVVHVAMLLWMLSFPWPVAVGVLSKISLPVMLIYPVTTAFLGWMMVNRGARYQAEESLRENAEKYRTLFENMAQGVFYQQADGALVDCNPAILEMFGLTRDQFMGKTSMDPSWKVIHEDGSDFTGEQHPSMEALRTGKPVQNVIAGVFNPRKENYVWQSINAIPQFKAEEDKPYQVFVTLHDITERKRSEEALAQRERYYRTLIFSLHEDILVIDRNYRITDINNTALQTLGMKREEVIGRHCYAVSHGLDAPCHEHGEQCGARTVFDTGKYCNLHHEHITADGEKAHIDIMMSPLRDEDGNLTHVVEAARDVTDLFQSQEALRESEERYRSLVELSPEAVFVHQEGIIKYINPSGAKIFGATNPKELIGKPAMELIHPDFHEAVKSRIEGVYNDHITLPSQELKYEWTKGRGDGYQCLCNEADCYESDCQYDSGGS
jgi:two-component system, sensor histidine kinase and response regulator